MSFNLNLNRFFLLSILLNFFLVSSEILSVTIWSDSQSCQGTPISNLSFVSGVCTGYEKVSNIFICNKNGTVTQSSWTNSSTCSGIPSETITIGQSCIAFDTKNETSLQYSCSASEQIYSLSKNVKANIWDNSQSCQGTPSMSVSIGSGVCKGMDRISSYYICNNKTVTMNLWTNSSSCSGIPSETFVLSQSCGLFRNYSSNFVCLETNQKSLTPTSSDQKIYISTFIFFILLILLE